MKTYTFNQLSEESKKNAIFNYAVKFNPFLPEYETICELIAKPHTYKFDKGGNFNK